MPLNLPQTHAINMKLMNFLNYLIISDLRLLCFSNGTFSSPFKLLSFDCVTRSQCRCVTSYSSVCLKWQGWPKVIYKFWIDYFPQDTSYFEYLDTFFFIWKQSLVNISSYGFCDSSNLAWDGYLAQEEIVDAGNSKVLIVNSPL